MLDKTTDPKRETIERMAREGASSASIGKAVGMSRSAVLGYCWRRKIKLLQGPVNGGKAAVAAKRDPLRRIKNLFIPAKPVREIRAAAVLTPLPIDGGKAIWDLKSGDCRWPLWGDEPPTGYFCGVEVEAGRSWCPAHRRIVYASSALPSSKPSA